MKTTLLSLRSSYFIGRLRPFISRAAAFIARRATAPYCLLALALLLLPCGCTKYDDNAIWDIWDRLNSQDARIAALEEWQATMNRDIVALQKIVTALQNYDYVTGVTSFDDPAPGGHQVSFARIGTITIWNGSNGADGEDGEDGEKGEKGDDGDPGATPLIGVKEADGVYYWTLDGEWLLDGNEDKIPVTGDKGDTGRPGDKGEPGDKGATPKVAIGSDNYWYICASGTCSDWTQDGEGWVKTDAVATGKQGIQGEQGDAIFAADGIDYDDDYVEFTLADGTTKISVPTYANFQKLEQEVATMNSNINALQTIVDALQNNDYVTAVTPFDEPAPGGHYVAFTKSGQITIWNGEKGDTGDTGSPGEDAPQIGVKEYPDASGIYYWTLDGEWLLDGNEDKIPVTGDKGDTGRPGDKGEPGDKGATPKVAIGSDNYWYICASGTCSDWTQDGEGWVKTDAVATGKQGIQGEQGDAIFAADGIDYDDDYVVFTLADGVTKISVPTYANFQKLEQKVATMNSNINALQAIVDALEDKDYVTGVTSFTNPAPGGYHVSFTKSGQITIWNGEKGDTGNTGAPGADAPQIGVKEYPDASGIYYWTLDGEWLLDGNEDKIPVTGNDGDPGNPGSNGQPGATPKVAIGTDNYWYVCPDGTCTDWTDNWETDGWQNTNVEATGPTGATGATGPQGDAIFAADGINYSNNDYVVFILANDGGTIQVPKYKPLGISFTQPEAFKNGQTKNITFTTSGNVQTITAVDVPRGWTVTPNTATSYITVTAPASDGKYYTAAGTVTLLVSDGAERTITAPLALSCPAYVPPAAPAITFTQPDIFNNSETKDIPFTLTGNATNVKVLDVPKDWTVAITLSGAAGTFTVKAPDTMNETNIGGGEALLLVLDAANNAVYRTLKLFGTPPDAASTQVWKFGDYIWSDRINVPACNKTGFTQDYTYSHCRSHTLNGTLGYYYNWTYVNVNGKTMCPAPWRVPTKGDIAALGAAVTSGDILTAAWGCTGIAGSSSLTSTNYGFLWSQDAYSVSYSWSLGYAASDFNLSSRNKSYGFPLRCVR